MSVSLEKLENGMRVLYIPQESMLSTTIMILVKVGSRYEDKVNNGIAHFVEHMFFKGTKKRPSSKAIGMAIERIGGNSNAFTSFDYTGYYIKVPKENLSEALKILADLMKNGLFKQEEIEKERGVIKEEIRMYEDNPMRKVSSLWFSEFFGDTPLGRDIAGTIESVDSMDRKFFMDFVDKYYVGDNILLTVSGGTEKEKTKELIIKNFSDLPNGSSKKFQNYEKQERKSKIKNFHKPLEQSHLILGGYSFPRDYQNKYTLKVGQAILSQGFGSRLFQVIRDKLGLAYYIYSKHQNLEEIGVFQIGLGVENSKVKLAVRALIEELRHIFKGNFDQEELERAKNYLLGGLVTDMENTDDFAVWYGLQELLMNRYDTIDEVKKQILGVQKNDVIDEMQKIYSGQNLLLVGLTPHQDLDGDIEDLLSL
ncbi:hypothetical protein GF362_00165 [Candidatus Dojkabacteria bacterium]|nr:hypothetical protein [Candidatus Dojkabacteria bacterium]